MVTWQITNKIYLLPRRLYPPNLTRWWLRARGYNSKSHMILWLRGHVRSRDKQKATYLQIYNTYGHQIWQCGALWYGVTTCRAMWHIDHAVKWSRKASQKACFFLETYDKKHDRFMVYGKGPLTAKF